MHRLFPAQPVEIRPERIGLEQLGIADVEICQGRGIGLVARGLQMGIAGEIDGSVHGPLSLTVPWRSMPEGRCFTLLHPEPRAGARSSWSIWPHRRRWPGGPDQDAHSPRDKRI